jgi:ATP-dependent exoDNAse (exonuclease V) beta subunit
LEENWRSAENLVRFNNAVFAVAAKNVSLATGQSLPTDAFMGHLQKSARHPGKGFVRIQFYERWFVREEDNGEQLALQQVPRILEELQEKGIGLQDVAILVRRNEEGQRIANYLLQYKNSPHAKLGCKYDVVSNESLRLDSASSVLLLISALKYLNNPHDSIARGELVYEYTSRRETIDPSKMESQFSQAARNRMSGLLPDDFVRRTNVLVKLSLFELTETLIGIFDLGEDATELAYLQSFQDQVLEFLALEKNDIGSFLDWWEEMKAKRSIQVSANTDAAAIYTIHKAKGMQFKFVILPFCSWKMDHEIAPLLWCRSDESPFDKLGDVVVRYNKELEKSYFEKDYRDEFTRSNLDNLNLLYVALTRAEEGLFVMGPTPSARSQESEVMKISNVGQLLCDSILESGDLKSEFETLTTTFKRGELELISKASEKGGFNLVPLKHYPTKDWRKKLVIKREGTEFFLEEKTEKRKRINYGILMHRALSLIHYKTDVEKALNRLYLEGVIVEEEVEQLKIQLEKMMNHAQVGSWFKNDWEVLTEVPVIIPQGPQDRIDRVILKPLKNNKSKAVVIDYKTGVKKAEDRKQVEAYSQALMEMGYVDVEGYLLYLENLDIIPVVNKTNLSLDL